MSAMPSRDRLTLLTQLVGTLEVVFGKKHLAVWRIEDSRVTPLYGLIEAAGRQRASVPRMCRRHASDLAAGRAAREGGSTLLPLIGGGLVGVVHVAGEPDAPSNVLLPIARAALDGLAVVLAMPDVPSMAMDALASGAPVADAMPTTQAQADAEVEAAGRLALDAERRRIVYLLNGSDWNVSQVARQLHWGRTKLYLRMRLLKISRSTPAPTDPRGGHDPLALAGTAG